MLVVNLDTHEDLRLNDGKETNKKKLMVRLDIEHLLKVKQIITAWIACYQLL